MKFEIKNKCSYEIIFSCEGDSWKFAVELAIKSKINLSSADLSSADLRSADLRSADLRYADLRSANLSSADLSSANLSSADLRSADLRYADLSSANLSSADLRYADLSSADLRYADLRYADLRYANLMTFQYQQHQAFYMFDGALRIGCLLMPITEWELGFKEIGEKNGYTGEQILMYGQFISMCMEHFKRNNPEQKG
jgi:hypothetical protein